MVSNWFGAGLVGLCVVFSFSLDFGLLIAAKYFPYIGCVYVNTLVSCCALFAASNFAILIGKAGKRSAPTRGNVKGLLKSVCT